MKKIIEVLRLKHEANLSHEKIARACQLSKGVVSKYLSLAQAKGLGWPLPEDTDEAALEALLFPAKAKPDRFVEPDYFQVHQELKRKGVTLQLLWAEYVARHGEWAYRYSRFCGRYREWRARQKRSLRQQHRAGGRPSSTTVAPPCPSSIATPARSVMPRSLSGCSGPPATPTPRPPTPSHCPTGSPPISACCASSVASPNCWSQIT